MPFRCRLATILLTFLPSLHTIEEDCWFIGNVILREREVTVAEDSSGLVSFLAGRSGCCTRPDRIGAGAGRQLVARAKRSGVDRLELWCFQANDRARRFYEARGFRPIRFTDRENNEEKMPDIRYRWDRAPTGQYNPIRPLTSGR